MHEFKVMELLYRELADYNVISIGSGPLSLQFVKKIAFRIVEEDLDVKVIPTSLKMAEILSSFKVPITSLNEREIDLAIEFVDRIDAKKNFVKLNSTSLIRDKMIGESASKLICICHKNDKVRRLNGKIDFEVSEFCLKRTQASLEKLGDSEIKKNGNRYFKTETGNPVIQVDVHSIYSLKDIEFQAKKFAGVIETGLFLDCCDKAILFDKMGSANTIEF